MSEEPGGGADGGELRDVQRALERERGLTECIIKSSVDGIIAFDREYRITVWNPAMERISGVEAANVIGRVALEIFPFLVEIGEDQNLREALAGNSLISRDRRYTVPSTGHAGYFEAHYTPLYGADGLVIGGLGVIRDITEHKQAQAQLLQAGRLAAMGQLGAGIAHELNQPLTGIGLLLNIMRSRPNESMATFADELRTIREQVDRMGKIVSNVRRFARRADFTPTPTPAVQPLEAALALMGEQIRLTGIELIEAVDDDLPVIHADPIQLQQVFLNLLSNALDALDGHDGPRRLAVGARRAAEGVAFWVEDSGPGIEDSLHGKIFEPFFTTKEAGRGTGLGLSLCYGILRDHGSTLRVTCPDGGGARFHFELAETALETAEPPKAEPITPSFGFGRVLVVDDESLLRRVVSRCLRHLGYRCETAEDAHSVLAREDLHTFDVALVDLKMPRMDGRALTAELGRLVPSLPIVIMSGFVTDEDRDRLLAHGVREVMLKPFDAEDLSETLGRVLKRPKVPAG